MPEPAPQVETATETVTEFQSNPTPVNEPTASAGADISSVDIEKLIADNQKLQSKVETVLGEKKRAQARANETDQKVQEMMKGFAQLMGLETEEPDAKALTSQVANLQEQITRSEIEKRAITAAYQKGIDPSIAVPVLKDQGKLNMSIADADFDVALEAAIAGLAEDYPHLVAGGGALEAKPKAVLPTPSGATPATNLDAQWEQVRATGNTEAIAAFVKEHGSSLWDTPTPRTKTIIG